MTYLIRDLPMDERPRERMLAHGAQTLSDAELLAVIIGTGAEGKNAIYLARELLHNGLSGLERRDRSALLTMRGVGPAKAARIAAVFELSRRVRIEPPPEKLMDVGDLGEALVRSHGHQMQERMGVVLVDARHRVMKQKEIFIGSLKETLVSTRDIIRYALLEHAAGIVVFHNHPSGDPTPSNDDITFTQQLAHSMMLVDVEFVDHLIIAAHRYCSMKQAGLVQPATRTGLGAVTSRSA